MATTTLLSVPSQTYPAGTRESGLFQLPGSGFAFFKASFPMNAADFADSSKAMDFSLLVQQPDSSFVEDSSFHWVGGGSATDKRGNPITGPSLTTSVENLIGKTCKLRMVLTQPTTFAITVTAS